MANGRKDAGRVLGGDLSVLTWLGAVLYVLRRYALALERIV